MDSSDRSPPSCLDSEPTELPRLTGVETAAIARALGNPTRLEILELFHVDCPRTVGDIVTEVPLAQSTISNHLRILRDAGVVRTLRRDARAWHCLNRSMLEAFARAAAALAKRPRHPSEDLDTGPHSRPNAPAIPDQIVSENTPDDDAAASTAPVGAGSASGTLA